MATAAAALALLASLVQNPQDATVTRVINAHAWAVRVGREAGDSLWPGFRPDTIPVLYVLRDRGALLLGWRGTLPEGFTPLPEHPDAGWRSSTDRGAASTGSAIDGRGVAQVVVDTQTVAALVGLTSHEAFHVFRANARGENSFLVTSYPVFNAENEAGWALEGRILDAAGLARNRASRRALAQQFLAAREARQRAIGPDLAAFESLGELNEGLAEYMLLRSVELASRYPDFPDRAGAARIEAHGREALEQLTDNVTRSIRLRFYATGPAIARLLDRLAGRKWKDDVTRRNVTLQDALAEASGYRATETALQRRAGASFGLTGLRRTADSSVATLRAARRRQADSLLAAPGILLVVEVQGGRIGLCGIDPQNLLQIEEGVLLHTRWVRPCAGDALQSTFNTPVVQDQNAATLRAVVGADSVVQLSVGGQRVDLRDGTHLTGAADVHFESPLFTLRSSRADITREGRVVTVKVTN